jgi:hypothetical protein
VNGGFIQFYTTRSLRLLEAGRMGLRCWMLDAWRFYVSFRLVKQQRSEDEEDSFWTVTLQQGTRGGVEALRPIRSRGPRPSSNVKKNRHFWSLKGEESTEMSAGWLCDLRFFVSPPS